MSKYLFGPKSYDDIQVIDVVDLLMGFGCETQIYDDPDVEVVIKDANGNHRIEWVLDLQFLASFGTDVTGDLEDEVHSIVVKSLLQIITSRDSIDVHSIAELAKIWEKKVEELYSDEIAALQNDEK